MKLKISKDPDLKGPKPDEQAIKKIANSVRLAISEEIKRFRCQPEAFVSYDDGALMLNIFLSDDELWNVKLEDVFSDDMERLLSDERAELATELRLLADRVEKMPCHDGIDK